jgi:hypothetical protein
MGAPPPESTGGEIWQRGTSNLNPLELTDGVSEHAMKIRKKYRTDDEFSQILATSQVGSPRAGFIQLAGL